MKTHPPRKAAPEAETARQKPSDDQIADAAYHLYIQRGRQDGHDWEDWLHAEKLLMEAYRHSQDASAAPPKPATSSPAHAFEPKQPPFPPNQQRTMTREAIRQHATPMRSAPRTVAAHAERSGNHH